MTLKNPPSWRNRLVSEMSREELILAFLEVSEDLEQEKEWHKKDLEMERMLTDTWEALAHRRN